MNTDVKAYSLNTHRKLFVQYTIILMAAMCIGYFIADALSDAFISFILQKIKLHFEIPFYGNIQGFSGYVRLIAKYALSDIICIIIIFLFTYSRICHVASSTVLIYLGIKSGATVSLLVLLFNSLPILETLVFILLKLFLIIIILRYAMRAFAFSEHLTGISSNDNKFVDILKFTVSSLLTLIFIAVLYLVYCMAIKNI